MKHYLALSAAPVPMGIITHYMRPINIAPRLVSKGKSPDQAFKLIISLPIKHSNNNKLLP